MVWNVLKKGQWIRSRMTGLGNGYLEEPDYGFDIKLFSG